MRAGRQSGRVWHFAHALCPPCYILFTRCKFYVAVTERNRERRAAYLPVVLFQRRSCDKLAAGATTLMCDNKSLAVARRMPENQTLLSTFVLSDTFSVYLSRGLTNDELHDLCSPLRVVPGDHSRATNGGPRTKHDGRLGMRQVFWLEKSKERDLPENLESDGLIILKFI